MNNIDNKTGDVDDNKDWRYINENDIANNNDRTTQDYTDNKSNEKVLINYLW